MAFKRGENPNHPKKGAAIKVDPIRDISVIAHIKASLLHARQYRNHALFCLGINTAWRANELLSLRVEHIQHLRAGDTLELKQPKTGRYRATPINSAAYEAIDIWLRHYSAPRYAPLFPSVRGGRLGVPALCNLVKRWCSDARAVGHFGSHSLRKTWGYQQRVKFGAPLSLISQALGHFSERQTLAYIGIEPAEITGLYAREI